MKQQIVELVKEILGEMGVPDVVPEVEVPEDASHGDYSTNVAMTALRELRTHNSMTKYKTPLEFAVAIKEKIIRHQKPSKLGWLDRVEVVPPGFINVFLTEASLISRLQEVLKEKEHYGRLRVGSHRGGGKQKTMVEFADPNPFKEFHIGHLRNIALGEGFSRILEAIGHEVRRANYQGDVGMHVAKSIWGLREILSEKPDVLVAANNPRAKAAVLGQAYARGAQAYEKSEKDKQEIMELNRKIYAQDPTIAEEWREGRQISLDYFDTLYGRLGTTFWRFYFESEVAPIGKKIVFEHIKDKVFEESDGAVIYRGEKAGLHTRVFVAKEGYATYEAKDMGLAILKYKEYPYERSIIMTGNEQSEYFKVMLAALREIQPDLEAKTRHIPFGMVNLTTGKMSSRTGQVVTAEWLIDEAKKRIYIILQKSATKYTKVQQDEIAEKAAVAAVKYAMLKVGAASDIAFDLAKSVSFEGDSGPYLQYTYARAKSVLRKAGMDYSSSEASSPSREGIKERSRLRSNDNDSVASLNSEERSVARSIGQFPDVVAAAAANFAPNTLCTYLFQLAQAFNLFYAKHTILGSSDSSERSDQASLRLALTAATAQVLTNGLYLLGIETLEQM